MTRAFQASMLLYNPEIVFVLGELPYYPHAFFFFKKAMGLLQSHPSVCPSVRHSISSFTIGRNQAKLVVCVT